MSSLRPTISKPALVTLALNELGGSHEPIDTEEIAVRAHELSPVAFAWRRYPQHINLELVRVALVGATRMHFVQGKGRGGWVLTDAGVAWVARTRAQLLEALGRTDVTSSPVRQTETAHRERERLRLGRTDALRKWRLGEPVSSFEACAVFRVDQYTVETTRLTKVRSLRDLFEDDPELGRFLAAMSIVAAEGASQSADGGSDD
jgi:transposase InsO family protein